jgi:hypothetical protein
MLQQELNNLPRRLEISEAKIVRLADTCAETPHSLLVTNTAQVDYVSFKTARISDSFGRGAASVLKTVCAF